MDNKFSYNLSNISTYRSEIYGISTLWIMLFHSVAVYAPWLQTFLSFGNMGCEIFIFISGVSLYFAYRNKKSVGSFTKKRMLRLLIPIFTIYMWEWAYFCIIGKITVLSLISRLASLHFWLTGEQQGWFVAFMLIAYLLYPYIYNYYYEKQNANILIRTLILLFCSYLLLQLIVAEMISYYGLVEIALTRFPVFFLGCAFGKAVYEKKVIRHGLFFYIGLLIIVVASFIVLNNVDFEFMIFQRLLYLIPGTALVFLLSKLFELTRKIYINKFFAFLGKMSLELYLLHLLVRRLIAYFDFYDPLNHLHYLIMLAGCVVVAYGISLFDQFLMKKLAR